MELTVTVNGEVHTLTIAPTTRLSELLRTRLDLTGAKEACNTASCGACTVLIDGRAVKSCSVLAAQANGRTVVTIEGLEGDGRLDPLQQAFIDHHGMQCGYCTPGMIMTLKGLLSETPHPTEFDVRAGIAGNLCRCGSYANIVKSALAASGHNGSHANG